MTNLTVYDLMGEDHEIWVKAADEDHVEIEILNENQSLVYAEKSHLFAWDSLVSFAKQVLACDKRLQQEIEIND